MDIKYLLCDTTYYSEQPYEKQVFDYCPCSPSSWSSKSSLSSELSDNTLFITNSLDHSKKKKQQRRTPWTSTEDCLLEKGYLQGLSWAMISAKYLPHRSRGCCWGRFKTLRAKLVEQHQKSLGTSRDMNRRRMLLLRSSNKRQQLPSLV
ncbi:MAG: hypothetical protein EXX96DRAFT_60242 [Benjaminiella poitrasii]|nr:MAG: hypothetical protein EXX96DRAFT_60242 [Benjaminiella poitrasii]